MSHPAPTVIRRAEPDDLAAWTIERHTLWPTTSIEDHRRQAEALLANEDAICVLALGANETLIGFAEAFLRRDYVNGCRTSPVAFLEGIYVDPEHRRAGVARALGAAVEAWANGKGVSELASDALLTNETSHKMHAALGFAETQRVVFFRKTVGG